MKYKIFLFDFDGTLVDTIEDITIAINYTLNNFGYNNLNKELVKTYVGDGAHSLIKKSFFYYNKDVNEETINNALKIFISYYEKYYFNKSKLFDGVEDTLKKLECIKIIYTNKPYIITEKILQKLDIIKYFEKIIAPETFNTRKPDPKPIFIISKEYKINLNQIVLIGDSQFDLKSAENAGIDSYLLTYGYERNYTKFNNKQLLNNFSDLLKL